MNALAALVVAALLMTAAPSTSDCRVNDGQLTWGFKESFRSYISGTIANGEWTVDDGATYETPSFGFDHGTGSFDGNGSIDFDGSIRFTGHGGILDTTVANPELRFAGDSARLYLDVRGTTQEGDAIDERQVEFATVNLAGHLTESNGSVSIVDAPATLTDEGATAFGTYESGEALDPITLTFTTGEGCVPAPAPVWLFGLLAIPVALAVAVVLIVRRRRALDAKN